MIKPLLLIALLATSAAAFELKRIPGAAAQYEEKQDIIVIWNASTLHYSQTFFYAMHEHAHALYTKLDAGQNAAYSGIHSDATAFVTPFARDCRAVFTCCVPWEEDFAETYAKLFKINWNTELFSNESMTERIAFMRRAGVI